MFKSKFSLVVAGLIFSIVLAINAEFATRIEFMAVSMVLAAGVVTFCYLWFYRNRQRCWIEDRIASLTNELKYARARNLGRTDVDDVTKIERERDIATMLKILKYRYNRALLRDDEDRIEYMWPYLDQAAQVCNNALKGGEYEPSESDFALL